VLALVTRRGRLVAAAVYVSINLIAIQLTIALGPHVDDWQLFTSLATRLEEGDLYRTSPAFVWSPVAAWILAAVTAIGYWPWVVLHFLSLILVRPPWLAVLTLSSWAFWWDTASAHTMTFVFVCGLLAIRGNRGGSLAYLALTILMPRPIQFPLALWILWKMPGTRMPFAGLALGHAVLVILIGLHWEWIQAMATFGGASSGIGPARYLGIAWLAIGIPLGLWLASVGKLGWAGVAISPHHLPQYLLMPLLDLGRRNADSPTTDDHGDKNALQSAPPRRPR